VTVTTEKYGSRTFRFIFRLNRFDVRKRDTVAPRFSKPEKVSFARTFRNRFFHVRRVISRTRCRGRRIPPVSPRAINAYFVRLGTFSFVPVHINTAVRSLKKKTTTVCIRRVFSIFPGWKRTAGWNRFAAAKSYRPQHYVTGGGGGGRIIGITSGNLPQYDDTRMSYSVHDFPGTVSRPRGARVNFRTDARAHVSYYERYRRTAVRNDFRVNYRVRQFIRHAYAF